MSERKSQSITDLLQVVVTQQFMAKCADSVFAKDYHIGVSQRVVREILATHAEQQVDTRED